MKHLLEQCVQKVNRKFFSCWLVLGIDTIIGAICTLLSYIGIHYIVSASFLGQNLLQVTLASLLFMVVGTFIFDTYRNAIRYTQLRDLWRIAGVTLFKGICMVVFVLFIFHDNLFHSQNLIFIMLDCMLTLIFLVGIRVIMIYIYERIITIFQKKRVRILIYGSDDKSVSLKMRLKHSPHYRVIGFIEFSETKKHMHLGNATLSSFSDEKSFLALTHKLDISGVLFSRFDDAKTEEKRLLAYCRDLNIKTMIAPSINEADVNGGLQQAIRPIKIEDLLGRDEIRINMDEVMAEFCNKVILVTGAAGSIGSELCRQLAQMNIKKLIMFDSAETPLHEVRLEFEKKYSDLQFVPIIGDVRVKERLRMVFDTYHPQIVFHAAAYKHVPLMEENPCEAVLANVIGSRQVADMAVEYGAEKMIMVSTDKAVNPTNVMGCSKRLAEIYVQSLGFAIREGKIKGHTKFVTTRFGNVLGSNGSVIPHFKEQIESGGPVTVTHPDIIRFFMTIPEACRLVMEAGAIGNGNEIFVFEMGKAVKIVDLATRMIELAGYRPEEDIKIKFTGLRPGEKLYEEVLSNEENTIPTENKKIMIAKVRHYEYADILNAYAEFERLSRSVKIMDTVKLMKEMVPEFISKNSPRFEVLDKEVQ